jgi:hypothetical protein
MPSGMAIEAKFQKQAKATFPMVVTPVSTTTV